LWGLTTTPPNQVEVAPPKEDNLPEYPTFNGLAPEFQLSAEHDLNHIFPKEYDLIGEVRSQVPGVANWPDRYILIFLFARRHSVSHTVKLINKHLNYLQSLGLAPLTEDNLYPFHATELSEEERKLAVFEGPLLYKHILVDKYNRLLQIVRPRCWIQGRISMKRYSATVLWWYYYSWQHVPLSIHRNGMSVVIDMTNMGWANLDFSVDVQQFISNALTSFPGRMRQAWIVNSNWILSTALTLLKMVLSPKLMSRMVPIGPDTLLEKVERQYIPKDLGGDWDIDVVKEWYEKTLELDREAREKREKK